MGKSHIIARERLYLTQDRQALVRFGNPAAAFLYCDDGHQVPAEAAARFGLGEDGVLKKGAPKAKVPAGEQEPEPQPQPQPRQRGKKPAGKQGGKGSDKSGAKPGITVNKAKKGS